MLDIIKPRLGVCHTLPELMRPSVGANKHLSVKRCYFTCRWRHKCRHQLLYLQTGVEQKCQTKTGSVFLITVSRILVSASSKSNSLSVLPRRSVLHSHSACWEIKTHWSSSSSGGGTDILTAVSMHRNTEELQYILHFKEIFLTTCVRCLPSSVTVAVAVCARHLQPSASRFLRSSKEFRDLLGITK